jgi:hypothetical protein
MNLAKVYTKYEVNLGLTKFHVSHYLAKKMSFANVSPNLKLINV